MHQPVLCREVIDLLRPRAGGVYVDATLGLGGHAEAIIKAGGSVVGIEWDDQAADLARKRLGGGVTIVRDSYANLPAIFGKLGLSVVDGFILDLGVSSLQFDSASRGFSLMREGPLDMRMSQQVPGTAADLIRSLGERDLERILREYGEEPRARRIAGALVGRRGESEGDILASTRALAGFVERLIGRRGRTHPATRVFQALRIAVNDELGNLKKFLDTFDTYLGAGGRACLISFHSLEDRMVKRSLRSNPNLRVVTRKVVRPTRAEVLENPRARSAKLRCAEKLEVDPGGEGSGGNT